MYRNSPSNKIRSLVSILKFLTVILNVFAPVGEHFHHAVLSVDSAQKIWLRNLLRKRITTVAEAPATYPPYRYQCHWLLKTYIHTHVIFKMNIWMNASFSNKFANSCLEQSELTQSWLEHLKRSTSDTHQLPGILENSRRVPHSFNCRAFWLGRKSFITIWGDNCVV